MLWNSTVIVLACLSNTKNENKNGFLFIYSFYSRINERLLEPKSSIKSNIFCWYTKGVTEVYKGV